ncbi:MAG: hypothetical protein CVT49_13305 [candidate division Zixibacteria bacterium HGW-Zixibacteria-1]|nr:MAG: hypothetical protein CVT49_13305 [candidate division Zixibacteria bacterium HGW-Zixibacteria-1]
MSQIVSVIAIVFLLSVSSLFGTDFKTAIDSLNNYSLDSLGEIEVNNLELEFRNVTVNLYQGKLYLGGHINEHPTAAFFLGEGRFIFKSNDPAEKQQIERFYRSDSADVEFDQLYMVFPANSKVSNLFPEGAERVDPSYRVKTLLKKIRSIPDSKFKYNLGFHLNRAILENRPDFLWVDVLKDAYQHTIYFYDPYAREQITLYKYTSNFKEPQIVSSTMDSLADGSNDYPIGYDNFRYYINVDISTYAKSEISCDIYCRIETDSLKQLSYIIPPDYKIDTVYGDVIDFIKDKDRPELLFDLSRFYYRGDTVEVSMKYRSNLFRHYMQHGIVQSDLTHWYPSVGYRKLSDYNLRFTIDRGFHFICVGEKVKDTIVGGRQILEYKTPGPVAYVSFNYGKFDSVAIDNAPVPITIEYYDGIKKSPVFGSPALDKVTEDVSRAFTFFYDNFGPYPYDDLDVAAMAVGFGQGSPGLVHLSEITFQRSLKGFDDKFRAHEIAHQWWGHLVNPDSYRDIWLSEGLSEYSAALYVLLGRHDEKTFREILKDWKNKVIQSGMINDKKSVGYKAGPISLGSRLGSELSPGDFEAIIYDKAAYVLHMLRFELELEESSHGRFIKMLADYAARYAGGKASTEDFISVVSPYLGDRTGQFFAQWLYDWRLPKIKSQSKINSEGSSEIDIDVHEVGDNFATPYPVRFILSDGSKNTVVYNIQKGENHFIYEAGNGLKVKAVNFNQDHDILER